MTDIKIQTKAIATQKLQSSVASEMNKPDGDLEQLIKKAEEKDDDKDDERAASTDSSGNDRTTSS